MDLVGITEAAKLTRLNYRQVFYRIKTGKLPAFRVGYGWAIRRKDLKLLEKK